MDRRRFLTGMLTAGASVGFRLPLTSAENYQGKRFVFVQADGGWDPTSFCDPKTNSRGEPVINHWAAAAGVRQAGNIPYAPFAQNARFFEKYYQRMLVINGVDAQTNSHTAGVIHNWSGRISEGYPTTTALLAARHGPGLAMPYLSFGGFSNTAGIAAFTRLNDPEHFQAIAKPEWNYRNEDRPFLGDADWESLRKYRAARAARLTAAPNLLPRAARNRRLFESALLPTATEGLREFADMLPTRRDLQPAEESENNQRSELKRQAQITVLAFKARVAVSADLYLNGFDTHDNHDERHSWLFGNLTDSVDFLWDYAGGPWRCGPPRCRDRLGLWPHEPLQRRSRQGPLADRQLHRDGEEPELDKPGGRGNGRAALRAQTQSGDTATRRHGRHTHPPAACTQGAPPLLGHRGRCGHPALPVRQHRRLAALRVSGSSPERAAPRLPLTMPAILRQVAKRRLRQGCLPLACFLLAAAVPAQDVLSIPTSADGTPLPPPGMTLEKMGIIDTLAGSGRQGDRGDGGPAAGAELDFPRSVAVDPDGNVYVAHPRSHRVRKIDTSGLISTLAGNGEDGDSGDGGPATDAELCFPSGVATDAAGNVYVADRCSHRVRKIDTDGVISTVAGNGSPGGGGDGGPAIEAQLAFPAAVAADPSGTLYVAEGGSHRVRKVSVDGVITRFAGTGRPGYSGDGGLAARARLANPAGVATDAAGNVYVADSWNHRIRKVDASGVISTIAGTGQRADGGDGGPAASAELAYPAAVALGPDGDLYVVTYGPNTGNRRIRRIAADGMISSFAGTGEEGFGGDSDPAPAAQLAYPLGVAVDSGGNVYIADAGNFRIRVVRTGLQHRVALGISGDTVALVVSEEGTLTKAGEAVREGDEVKAGNGSTYSLTQGADGLVVASYVPEAQQVQLGVGGGVTLTRDEDGTWRIDGEPVKNGHRHSFGGRSIVLELADGTWGVAEYVIEAAAGSTVVAEGVPATSAPVSRPTNVAVDAMGNVYFTGRYEHRVRKIDAAGVVTTFAGTGEWGSSGDNGPASRARLFGPAGLAFDRAGNLYVAERFGRRVRRVDPRGVITTVAGSGSCCYSGDGGRAVEAEFDRPSGVATDSRGNLYVTDRSNGRIRKIDAGGLISTIAGTGRRGYTGDGGPATLAEVQPTGIAVDSANRVYVVQPQQHLVRRIDAQGIITAFAGIGERGYGGDGGPAVHAQLSRPRRVAVDVAGNAYVTDGDNRRIRRISTIGVITTFAGSGDCCWDGDGGRAVEAEFNQPSGVATDARGNVYVTDRSDHRIRKIDAAGVVSTVAGTGEKARSEDSGPASQTRFEELSAIAVNTAGDVLFADHERIWKLDSSGLVTRLSCCRGTVADLAVDSRGRVFAAEIYNSQIQMIDAAGNVSAFAGSGDRGFGGDGGPATQASLNRPCNVAADRSGNVFVVERDNYRIRKIDTSGVISTFAGTGTRGSGGDGGLATAAQLDSLCGALATDSLGNVYLAERWSRRVRRIDTAGVITTIGTLPNEIERPVVALAADGSDRLFLGTEWQILRSDREGSFSVIAGTGRDGYGGDGGPARSGGLSVARIAVDRFGDVWLADRESKRVRVLRRQ